MYFLFFLFSHTPIDVLAMVTSYKEQGVARDLSSPMGFSWDLYTHSSNIGSTLLEDVLANDMTVGRPDHVRVRVPSYSQVVYKGIQPHIDLERKYILVSLTWCI